MMATTTTTKMERALAWAAAPTRIALAKETPPPAASSTSTASAASTASTTNARATTRAHVKPPMAPPPKMHEPHPLDVFAAAMEQRAAAVHGGDHSNEEDEAQEAQAHDQGEWELARMRCSATASYVPYAAKLVQTKRGDAVVEAARLASHLQAMRQAMASLATAIEAATEDTTVNSNKTVGVDVIRERFLGVQDALCGVTQSARVMNGLAVSQVTILGAEITRLSHWTHEGEVRAATLVSKLAARDREVSAQRATAQPSHDAATPTSTPVSAAIKVASIALPTDIDIDEDPESDVDVDMETQTGLEIESLPTSDEDGILAHQDEKPIDDHLEGDQVGAINYQSKCMTLRAQNEMNKRSLHAVEEYLIVMERELAESRVTMNAAMGESSTVPGRTKCGNNNSGNDASVASTTTLASGTLSLTTKTETSTKAHAKTKAATKQSGIPEPKIKVPVGCYVRGQAAPSGLSSRTASRAVAPSSGPPRRSQEPGLSLVDADQVAQVHQRQVPTVAATTMVAAQPAVPLIRNHQNKNKNKATDAMAPKPTKPGNVAGTATATARASASAPARGTTTATTSSHTRPRARKAVASPQVRAWR